MKAALFNENMSYTEALNVFFTSMTQDRSQEETSRIKTDFDRIVPIIIRRELSGDNTTLTSYPI